MILDFHTHTFPDKIAERTLSLLSEKSRTLPFTDGTVSGLRDSMKKNGIDYSVTLPVATRADQVEKLNRYVIDNQEQLREAGLIPFGAMHPLCENPKQELKRLAEEGIRGIKLHPAYQSTDFDDISFLRILSFASELGLITVTHAGLDIGIPGHNYTSVKAVLNVLKEVSPDNLVLAHMGGWNGWDEVLQDLAGAPVYLDTAFSLGPISTLPESPAPEVTENLNADCFTALCRKHGIHRILFASDSPWADQGEYVSFIRNTDLTETEQNMIFFENGALLLK